MVFETKRLCLRKLNIDDLDDLREILQNPTVMYAYEHAFEEEEVITWFDNQQRRYINDGFGLWAVILKDNNEMIGQVGLTLQKIRNNKEVVEIGYLLKEKYWHNGYALEAAIGCKEYAFDYLNLNKVYSIIKHNNEVSKKVAIKLGMKKEGEFVKHYYNQDMLHFIFSLKNDKI